MNWREARLLVSAASQRQFPSHQRREIALAGRSNVGKSSLINRLAGRRDLARTSQTPGRTRTLNFYAVGDRLCIVDMPGYGYAKVSHAERSGWAKVIDAYLARRTQLVGVIQVVDLRHPPSELDYTMARWLREHGMARGLTFVAAATKADKIARGRRKGRADALARELNMPVVVFSALTGEGVSELLRWMKDLVTPSPGDVGDAREELPGFLPK